ncbi:E3 ubiquitin-protein ligase APD2-like protein [Drosera capensis]
MEPPHHTTITTSTATTSDYAAAGPSTTSSSPDQLESSEQQGVEAAAAQPNNNNSNSHRRSRRHQPTGVSTRFNVPELSSGDTRDDVWSCLVVLVTFWFFAATMTLILGFYGSEELQLGPSCSRLVVTNRLFVQSIKGQVEDQVSGLMLYGFRGIPPLDVETTWTESHSEWEYYLNTGSYVDISYDVKSPSHALMSLVIAQGEENLIEWVDDPSYPNSTLSWNIIYGIGKIEQEIMSSGTYYIAIGNLNSEVVEVVLNFTIKAALYNTTQAIFKCTLTDSACVFDLSLLQENVVVLTSPGPEQAKEPDDGWYVTISYGPRWATYIVGSDSVTFGRKTMRIGRDMIQQKEDKGAKSHCFLPKTTISRAGVRPMTLLHMMKMTWRNRFKMGSLRKKGISRTETLAGSVSYVMMLKETVSFYLVGIALPASLAGPRSLKRSELAQYVEGR